MKICNCTLKYMLIPQLATLVEYPSVRVQLFGYCSAVLVKMKSETTPLHHRLAIQMQPLPLLEACSPFCKHAFSACLLFVVLEYIQRFLQPAPSGPVSSNTMPSVGGMQSDASEYNVCILLINNCLNSSLLFFLTEFINWSKLNL